MSDVRKGNASFPYMQPVPLTARAINNAPENNIPELAQSFSKPTPKQKILKKRAKKVNTAYRVLSKRKPTTRSSKSARDTPADNCINKDISKFSDNDEIENEEAYLYGFSVNKDYINTINTAIGYNLKMTITFMRNML
jgi:hypothetical protein